MNRRQFLGTLMASIGAATVIDPADLLWKPAGLEGLPEVYPGAALTLWQITEAVGKRLSLLHPGGRYMPLYNMVGQGPMTNQYNVTANPDRYAALGPAGFDDTLIQPVVALMSARIKKCSLTSFGELMVPNGDGIRGVIWNDERMAVRGCAGVYFDSSAGDWRSLIRFDLLGGMGFGAGV